MLLTFASGVYEIIRPALSAFQNWNLKCRNLKSGKYILLVIMFFLEVNFLQIVGFEHKKFLNYSKFHDQPTEN